MPAIKFVNQSGDYLEIAAVENTILYCTDIRKTNYQHIGCYPSLSTDYCDWIEEFLMVKHIYHKEKGEQVKHRIVSFSEWELVNYRDAEQFGYEVARAYGENYQTVYAVHQDKVHVHVHFIINTVAYNTGKRFDWGPAEYTWLRHITDNWLKNHESRIDCIGMEAYGF